MNKLFVTGIDISDFKRVRLIRNMQIDPEKGLITIGGENENGKSSILDAIQWTLASVNVVNRDRDGADAPARARVILSAKTPDGYKPAFKVVRTDKGLTVQTMDDIDMDVRKPAEWLRSVLGAVMVDPVAFLTMPPRDQRAKLIAALGIDPAEIDAKIKAAKDAKDRLESTQAQAKARVQGLPEHPDVTELEEVSVSDLLTEMTAANQHNMAIQAKTQKHRTATEEVERLRALLAAAEAEVKATDPSGDAPIDTSAIEAKIAGVQGLNEKIRDNRAKRLARQDWEKAEAELGTAVAAYNDARKQKIDMLASAKMPCEDLDFDDDGLTLKGKPFADSSMSQRIRAATAISLAGAGDLPLVLIRDASTLDNRSLAELAKTAHELGAQVLAEIVSNKIEDAWDRKTDFVVEDGQIVDAPQFVPARAGQ